MKIAETYLVEDEAVDAEAFVNRASALMEAVQDYWLQLRYRVVQAKVLDANRKFLEAALRYYELSQAQRREIPQVRRMMDGLQPRRVGRVVVADPPCPLARQQHELLQLLAHSVTCAILGKAGPQRSRVLGTLHKDERKQSLETLGPQYAAHAKVSKCRWKETPWCPATG